MPTYLLTWNPQTWHWPDQSEQASAVAAGRMVRRWWSTGVRTRGIPKGSRLFLLRQGPEPRGIIGSGHAAGESAVQPHYDPVRAEAGERALFTPLEFDALLDVERQAPLPRALLDSPELKSVNWNAAGGGIEIENFAASALERAWAAHIGQVEPTARFIVGGTYTRFDVLAKLGLPPKQGGNPFTGYFRRGTEFFLFPTIGNEPGATGHNYPNEWESPGVLRWYTKANASPFASSVHGLLSESSTVHLFARTEGRSPFVYQGRVRPIDFSGDSPVQVRWRVIAQGVLQNWLRLVEDPSEVRDNLRHFAAGAVAHRDRAAVIAQRTTYWVYDSDTGAFAPSKFVGYSGMTFDRYERATAGDFEGSAFHGHLTQIAISSVCGSGYESNSVLTTSLGRWLNGLFGPDGPQPRQDAVFLSLSPGEAAEAAEPSGLMSEGAVRWVLLSVRERDPKARAACLGHYGPRCQVCGMTFEEVYGPIGEGFMHVHHLEPIARADGPREVDPVRDLRPVCPNCHAMLHREEPPLALEELQRQLLERCSRLDR